MAVTEMAFFILKTVISNNSYWLSPHFDENWVEIPHPWEGSDGNNISETAGVEMAWTAWFGLTLLENGCTDVVNPCGLLFRSFFFVLVGSVFSYPTGTVRVRQVINMRFPVAPGTTAEERVFSRTLMGSSANGGCGGGQHWAREQEAQTTVSGGRLAGSSSSPSSPGAACSF